MEKRRDLGLRIREVRKRLGANQDAFGARLGGLSKSAVSAYEAGDTSPSPETLAKIADLGGVTIDWLVTGRGEEYGEARASDPRLEAAVREHAGGWSSAGAPASDLERRVIGMLRQLSPEVRQQILDTLTIAYFDEMESRGN